MNVTPLSAPLPGEHLAATWPTMRLDLDDSRPRTDPRWRQRMRFWSGRAATAEALERDQENRAAHLAWQARMLTAGVINGLEVALEPQSQPMTLQIVRVETREELPVDGRSVAIVGRIGDALHFRVFDADHQRIRDLADTDIEGRTTERDQLRARIAALPDPAAPTAAQRDEILRDLSLLLQYRLSLAGYFVHVLPGSGLTLLGEDVTVPRALRVDLAEVPVRNLAAGETPWASVLVVRPAEIGRFANVEATDPCELDPSSDAFADERRQDAAMLELVPLPEEWRTLPALTATGDARWRNRLVNVLLTDEAERAARQQLRFRAPLPIGQRWDVFFARGEPRPWELEVSSVFRAEDQLPVLLAGVPLALVGDEVVPGATTRRLFLDRNSVVRRGGQAKPRVHPAIRTGTAEALDPAGNGTPALWRARVDQFAEHFGALDPQATVASRAERFQFLPPAGLLPREALKFLNTDEARAVAATDRAATSHIFPANVPVEAVPMPVEDLDAALAASAPLHPIDLLARTADPVRVIVPVPQRVFDPRLLVIEQEDPVFLQEIGRLVAERQDWRQRRDAVFADQRALRLTASGPPAPELIDRGQLEAEPVETRLTNGFLAALRSPTAAPANPVELRLTFPAHVVSADTLVYVRVRTDNETAVPPIDAQWLNGDRALAHRFSPPPAYSLEQRGADGQPLATPLWRVFSVRAGELGIGRSADLTGFTLHLDSGHVALSDVGEISRDRETGAPVLAPWWRAQEVVTGINVEFVGGDWTLVSGGRELVPFEEEFVPTFDDQSTVASRTAEVDLAITPAGSIPRLDRAGREIRISVATHGLEKSLAELDAQASEADDFVDAYFTRAQTNLYRIRKLILGETAAQKLLINPAIATIAEQETASASAEKLGAFVSNAKGRTVTAREVNVAIGATAAPTAPAGTPPTFSTGAASGFARAEFFERVSPTNFAFAEAATIRADSRFSSAALDKGAVLKDVLGQRAEAGATLPPRGLSIGKRFEEPKATDNLAYARSALVQLLDQLPNVRLPLDGETVIPVDRNATVTPVLLLDLQGRSAPRAGKTTATLRTEARTALLKVGALPETDAAGSPARIDEAEITLAALDFTETKSAILRTIEKVVLSKRTTLARGRETLAIVQSTLARAQNRLGVIAPRLAEARHDVSVARALRQEELERLAAINARRDAIIRDEVRFLAFVRPRYVDPVRRTLTGWKLESDDAPGDVPACLQRHDDPPDELRAYIQLFRHAPARWFTDIAPRLKVLNTRDKLTELLEHARTDAIRFTAAKTIPFVPATIAAGPFATLRAAHSLIDATRRETARFTLAPSVLSWADQQRAALQHASLGNIIDGRHGQTALARRAAEELENIESVSACLHAEFAAVAPAIRLSWLERYSQFDRPSPLHDLTVLPGFGSLARQTRRRFQSLVDWLFGRIDRKERDAVLLVNDLVRICLLLASHAPVKQLIAGHVPRPVPVRPGVLVPIKPLDPKLVRVGMEFHVWQANTVVARGLVEDLQDGEVAARVSHVTTVTGVTTIDQTMRVQFVAPAFAITTASTTAITTLAANFR